MYKVKTIDNLFCVLEVKTNLIIRTFEKKYDAVSSMKFLNSGGGFNGDTPRYLLNGWIHRKISA